eukprot:53169-Rhodomonas_salina.1
MHVYSPAASIHAMNSKQNAVTWYSCLYLPNVNGHTHAKAMKHVVDTAVIALYHRKPTLLLLITAWITVWVSPIPTTNAKCQLCSAKDSIALKHVTLRHAAKKRRLDPRPQTNTIVHPHKNV